VSSERRKLPAVIEAVAPVKTSTLRSTLAVPAMIADAGEHAARRFLEFFAATIRNKNTRMAYTNTPMISDEAGFDRAQLVQPEVMAPPLVGLVSDAAGKVIGRRFLAVHWDPALPPEQAAEKAGAPVAWTSIATMPITPSRS
jgi:hypothetical protein